MTDSQSSKRLKRGRSQSTDSSNGPSNESERTLTDDDMMVMIIEKPTGTTTQPSGQESNESVANSVIEEIASIPKPQAEYIRMDDLWFRDGNLVLEARGCVFKVYAGYLETHSTNFRDLAPGNEKYNGVRLLHLPSEWSYEDVKNVLMVLFYPNRFYQTISDSRAPEFLSSLLHMSHTLGIASLEKDALLRLAQDYPKSRPKSFEEPKVYEELHVIDAAQRTGYTVLLPMAYYYLSCRPIEYITSTIDQIVGSDSSPILATKSNINDCGHLPPSQVLKNCLIGREKLSKLHREKVWPLVQTWIDPTRYFHCSHVLQTFCKSPGFSAMLYLPTVFHELDAIFENAEKDPEMRLCNVCSSLFWKPVDAARDEVWNELPEIFGLPKWSALKG